MKYSVDNWFKEVKEFDNNNIKLVQRKLFEKFLQIVKCVN